MTPESKFVNVRDIRLHYADWGDNGPTLMLFHGDQRTSRSWDAVARRLQDRFHVIAPDARGHGVSEWTERGYRMADRVADVIAFMDAAGLKDVPVAAHSTGAAIIAHAALERPDLINNMLLIETLLVLDQQFQERVSERAHGAKRAWPSRQEFHDYLHWNRATRMWHTEVISDVANHEVRETADGSVESMWAPQTFNAEERADDFFNLHDSLLVGLRQSVSFLVSANRGEEGIDEIRKTLPGMRSGQLSVYDGVGHNVYMEQPDTVADLIVDFAAGNPLPENLTATPNWPRE